MRQRSLLFVPGSRSDRFDKAVQAGADTIILDLEDAVAPLDKDTARAEVRGWLSAGNKAIVRINSVGTPWHARDLALAKLQGVIAIMLPKAESAKDIADIMQAGAKQVLPLIETAAGIVSVLKIATAPGVARLAFGSIDFQVDLGMRDAHEDELLFFRSQLVLASRIAGIASPIDGVTTAIDDVEKLRVDVGRARRLGFGGKLCIHPGQIEEVHQGFTPDAQTISWAQRVIAAASSGNVVAVDGKMVDKPVLLRAEAILREAKA
jgi:citrate lyase subunit beta/citryl-CoA lyase